MLKRVIKIIEQYDIKGELVDISANNSGNINSTYVATFNDNGELKKYLIQKINTAVFTEPYKLMKNIEGVTSYLKKQMQKENDYEHQVLDVIKTRDNDLLCFVQENDVREYYRIYNFIENAIAYNQSTDLDVVYNTGQAFGNFQKLLRDYPIDKLHETIPDFHNTIKRYYKLIEDVKIDSNNRAMEVAKEIVSVIKRFDICSSIISKLGTFEIPYRVTHNDTKVNNVMVNIETGKYMAVIDLDTVMPGSMLFDYGDGIRSTASTAKEDETDLTKVHLDLELFKAYTSGYLSEMAPYLTKEELSLMGESIRIITLELAIRFLNDYINGDTYFKTTYPKHNLDRTRNQLALVEDIENNLDFINNYIYECYNQLMGQNLVRSKKLDTNK